MPKIIIVEDEVLIAEDISSSLEALGYKVSSILTSGEDAIVRVAEEKPDAVLMDIHLRDTMDGIEAAETIYQQHKIPVIFLTAYSDDTLLDRAKKTGSFGYLLKPFEDRELKVMIEMALYKSQRDREREQFEKNAIMCQKHDSLRTLAGGIAHNFNNILAGVLGNIELAQEDLLQANISSKYFHNAQLCAERAAKLSKLMLTYVGHPQNNRKVMSLSGAIEELSDILRVAVNGRAELEIIVEDENIYINSDRAMLSQIINNLVQNSAEAIEGENGVISITVKKKRFDSPILPQPFARNKLPPAEYAVLEVTDNGQGMDQGVLDKAFDPFFSTKFTGRGLGLPATLGIVETLGGNISLRSKQNSGTTATIVFPLSTKRAESLTLESDRLISAWRGSGCVLIVDDEEALRSSGKMVLEKLGFEALTAEDGIEALELYRIHHENIRCVLLDIVMPRAEGIKTFHQLKHLDKNIKIIVSTGYDEEQASTSFGEIQPDAYLQKPYMSKELRNKLHAIFVRDNA